MAQGRLEDLPRHIDEALIETVMESEAETLVGRRHGLNRTRQAYRWGPLGRLLRYRWTGSSLAPAAHSQPPPPAAGNPLGQL
jgi:hypothetical protein